MYQIIKQYLVAGVYYDEPLMIVYSEDEAHQIVQKIRKQDNNQLCYFREVK